MSDAIRQAYDLLRSESLYWAMSTDHLDGLAARVASQASKHAMPQKQPSTTAAQNVAVVPIVGPLVKRGSFFSEFFGLSSYDRIRQQLAHAVSDRSIDKILLFVDSPGGSVGGCEETAAAVAAAARVKPVMAFCDGLIASAAYWIGSQARSITITPSGEAGSIGVIALHVDMSEALKQAGLAPTFLISKVSPRKADINSYQPITPDAKARALADLDNIAGKFVGAVARGRSTTSSSVGERFGKGGCLMAEAALAAGMVDAIGSISDAMTGPLDRSVTANRASAAGADYRAKIAQLAAESMSPTERARKAEADRVRRRLAILSA